MSGLKKNITGVLIKSITHVNLDLILEDLMDTSLLEQYAQQLLDTGKRNNLVNFKDVKSSTVEIVLPDPDTLFSKVDSSTAFEVFDPKLDYEEDIISEILDDNTIDNVSQENKERDKNKKLNRDEYISTYSSKIKKANQLLLYSHYMNPVDVVKNIDKKNREYVDETGVNVAYLAFGFIHWTEREDSKIEYRAPLLLAPVTISNESKISPYYIHMTEDDVVLNPTFSFILSQQYNISLPTYEDQYLKEYIDSISTLIKPLHWTVTSECKLGIFSFLKINMYMDLMEHKDVCMENPIIAQLLGQGTSDPVSTLSIKEGECDLKNPLIELHNIVDADSSQIEAIEMAKAGKSFVLQGPPGTGKSQTISNIIAELLSDGKKVLFVSEKLAALNVVFHKMKLAGLDDFCLELHSYKSNKKEVIQNLCDTLHLATSKVSSKAESELQKKEEAQIELDKYDYELHKQRDKINKSLYQMYNAYSSCRKMEDLEYVIPDISSKGEDYLFKACKSLDQYSGYVPTIGYDYKLNPWYGFDNSNTTAELRLKLKENLERCIIFQEQLLPIADEIQDELSVECQTMDAIKFWNRFFGFLEDDHVVTPDFFKKDTFARVKETFTSLAETGKDVNKIKADLGNDFRDGLFDIPAEEYHQRLVANYSGFFARLFSSDYRGIINSIRIQKKGNTKVSYKDALAITEKVSELQYKNKVFNDKESTFLQQIGSSYAGLDTDWDKIETKLTGFSQLVEAGFDTSYFFTMEKADFEALHEKFAKWHYEIDNAFKAKDYDEDFLCSCFDSDIFDFNLDKTEDVHRKLATCLRTFDQIDNWGNFVLLLNEIKSIPNLLEALDFELKNEIEVEKITDTFRKIFYRDWIDNILHSTPDLAQFSRIRHDKVVELFKMEDKTQFDISKAQIKAKLSAMRPSASMAAAGSAVSILIREGEKKRKIKSIRKLFEETGDLIQVLKPLFMMSPLSVSTFLNAEIIHFDTVIFDEASQVFPQDALGAIYRGNQLIVVGDSKQMPPSNFFNASLDSDDNSEDETAKDFESILDLCSTSLPQKRLQWHYRSRFEELIDFSNKNYYNNDLISFPSSRIKEEGIGVDFYFAGGIFDRTSKTNMKEAEKVVDLVYKHAAEHPNRSLGVVAFSASQQNLIDKLIQKRRDIDPAFEDFFRRDTEEPFFVKNLESVQGDERDTIIFSIAYAKDKNNVFYHNFGPLNRVGGERRLNVAVTRAKYNVQVVASIHYSDIDLNRTSAVGARLLREYLDFAENGPQALDRSITVNPEDQFDSEFEQEVAEFLRSNGFVVDTQVGCSNFRIDLALKKPNSSKYVLAIECDGAAYHSTKNARDRDRLRQSILESMGWTFYRIWSTDWFKNTKNEKDRLKLACENALLEDNNSTLKTNFILVDADSSFEEISEVEETVFEKYVSCDALAEMYKSPVFCENIKRIMEVEAPISEAFLLKRIISFFGRSKVTNIVNNTFDRYMGRCESYGIERRDGFLYFSGDDDYQLRLPSDDIKRDVSDIALEELASGMLVLIQQNISVEIMDLYRSLAKLLGFTRVGDNITERFDEALALLDNEVTVDGSIVRIKQSVL